MRRFPSSGAISSTVASSSSVSAHGDDEVRVILGDIDERFVAMYGHGGRLRGVLGVGMPKPVMRMRKLISDRASWETAVTYAADLAQ